MAGRITQYIVVADTSLDDLVAAVNANIENGWEPIGGVNVVSRTYTVHPSEGWGESYIDSERSYYQAMVWREVE